jgi:acetolactate synthase-1/2/3 large subunit
MILFVGQIERGMREREAFQEVDYRAAFGPIAKWATEIDDRRPHPGADLPRLPRGDERAPGPGRDRAARGHAHGSGQRRGRAPRRVRSRPIPASPRWPRSRRCCGPRKRPLVILGGSRWSDAAVQRFARFRRALRSPRGGLVPAPDADLARSLPSYRGDLGLGANPKLVQRIKESDLVLLLGRAPLRGALAELHPASTSRSRARFSSTCTRIRRRSPGSTARIWRSTPRRIAFSAALEGCSPRTASAGANGPRSARRLARPGAIPGSITTPVRLQMGQVMAHLKEVLPADTDASATGAG